MAAWMLYCAAVAAAAALCAFAAERALLLYRRPVRWAWAASLAASLAVPAAAWLAPARVPAPRPAAAPAADASAWQGVRTIVAADAPLGVGLPPLDAPLRALWMGASGATLLGLAGMHLALRRRRRAWTAAEVDGVPVLVSPDVGPAVVGFVRGAVVLPRWVLDADDDTRALVLAHEREHLRAGDTRLLLLALAAVAAAPWNPALWWQLRRLRLGMEVDCDARVLRARGTVREYGAVLLTLGRRASAGLLGAAAFSEPTSFLERRIRIMTSQTAPARLARAAAFAGLALAAAGAAGATPRPSAAGPQTAAARVAIRAKGDTLPGAPTQAQAVATARARHPELFAAHTRGTTYVAVRTDEAGQVTSSATGTTLGAAMSGQGGSEVGPTYSATITRAAIPGDQPGPDSLVVMWTHTLSAAEMARQHAAAQQSTDDVIAAIDRYFPAFRATGEPAAMYFVVASTGEVLRSGVAPASGQMSGGGPGHLPHIPPTSIDRVSVHKGNGLVLGAHAAQVIWIVLKPGAQPPAQ